MTIRRRLARLEHRRRPDGAEGMPPLVVAIADDSLVPGAVIELQAGPGLRVVRAHPETTDADCRR